MNSATSCLELCLRFFSIGHGDEVITSAYTYSASCSVICHVGATPVLVDTAENSFEMDYNSLLKAITSKTKAIIPVDIGGRLCNYEKIFQIVNIKKNVFSPNNSIQALLGRVLVLADAAHSFGAFIKKKENLIVSGSIADFTVFSFHAVKNLTTAEGGALTWKSLEGLDDEEVYNKFMLMSLHGQSKDAFSKLKLSSWEYDIKLLGYKCNMTDISASIGLAQLQRYKNILKKRKNIINLYNKLLSKEFTLLNHFDSESHSSGHLFCVRLDGKDEDFRNLVIEEMGKNNIATNVHYKPLPMHTAYKNLGFKIKDFPNAYNVYKNEITLPLYNTLEEEDVVFVVETLKKSVKSLNRRRN
jgi:dTDP-4-amino-4,6-dideoxygalactose transaminase